MLAHELMLARCDFQFIEIWSTFAGCCIPHRHFYENFIISLKNAALLAFIYLAKIEYLSRYFKQETLNSRQRSQIKAHECMFNNIRQATFLQPILSIACRRGLYFVCFIAICNIRSLLDPICTQMVTPNKIAGLGIRIKMVGTNYALRVVCWRCSILLSLRTIRHKCNHSRSQTAIIRINQILQLLIIITGAWNLE